MPPITSRTTLNVITPYRTSRPTTSKIIFLSCEGCETEEQYFKHLPTLFDGIKSKIQFISVVEDIVNIPIQHRTPEQALVLSKSRPKHLVERIEQFKIEKNSLYQFSEHPDDEFWIITDVDKNWSNDKTNPVDNKTYKQEWDEAIALCEERNYHYAVSNPFFEMWLLLHHDNPTPEDTSFAVTDDHPYRKTSHFRGRLRSLKVPLIKKKTIKAENYTQEKVLAAISRAKQLHKDPSDLTPRYYATTVYMLLDKMMDILQNKAIGTNPADL